MMKRLLIASAALVVSLGTASVQAEAPAKYNMYCIACHGTGAAGAPMTGDKAAWETRLAVGMDALIESSKKGKNAMPPMGLCNDCTDDDFKALIEYMAK